MSGWRAAVHRGASLLVLSVFLLGNGPASLVRPCPIPMPGHPSASASDATGSAHISHSARTDTDRDARIHDGPMGPVGDPTDPHPPGGTHEDGPCDCLGLCLTCVGPALGNSPGGWSVAAPDGAVLRTILTPHLGDPDPAPYLRPFARPPPA